MAFAHRKHSLALVLVVFVFLGHVLFSVPAIEAASSLEDVKNEPLEYNNANNNGNSNNNNRLMPSGGIGGNNYRTNSNNNNNMLFNTKSAGNSLIGSKRNMRSIYGLGPKMLQIARSKIPIELDLLVENGDDGDRSKRFDDYGHMRFGKRGGEEQFDDYGHMRFGRST